MDSTNRDMDLWMENTLTDWAEQGSLSSDKSIQLDNLIYRLAGQGRRNRFIRMAYGFLATVFTYIILLFAICPAAAAAFQDSTVLPSRISQLASFFILAIGAVLFLIRYNRHVIAKRVGPLASSTDDTMGNPTLLAI